QNGDADERAAEERLHEVEAVRHQEAEPLPRPDPETEQRAGRPPRTLDEVGVGATVVREDERLRIGPARGAAHEHVADRRDLRPDDAAILLWDDRAMTETSDLAAQLALLEDERAVLRTLHTYGQSIDYGEEEAWV